MIVRQIFPILLAMVLAVCSGCTTEQEKVDIRPDMEKEEAVSIAEVGYTLRVVDKHGRSVPGVGSCGSSAVCPCGGVYPDDVCSGLLPVLCF